MKSKKLKEEILKLSEGILSYSVDLTLWTLVYLGELSTTFSRNTWEPARKADKFIEEINYETIKNAIENGRKKGWIKRSNNRRSWPQITEEGKRRLNSIIPQYDNKRVWDRRIYLITYDIPEEKKKDRELLREYLKRIGAGMVQKSVWLTPFNPSNILNDFIKDAHLDGTIIISSIGKDGYIGEEDIKDLVARIYKLDELNREYKNFLDKSFESNFFSHPKVSFSYWKILKKDPQLPFDLLPVNWLGEEAHKLFLKLLPAKLTT